MTSCPVNQYFSTFLDSCIRCPDQIQNCDDEGPSDSQTCRKSCTDTRSPLLNDGLSNVSKNSSRAVVIGTVVGLLALLVLVITVGVLLYYRYVKSRRSGVPRDTEGNPHEDEPRAVDSQSLLTTHSSNMAESDETAHEGLEMELTTRNGEMELHNPDEIPGSVDKST